jgi:hypothetical protein
VVQPWLRFHIPLIEPDRQICRVARPLLAFTPTDPTVRRYRSGLFRKDPEAGRSFPPCLVDHRFRKRESDQELAVGRPVDAAFLATFAEHLTPVLDDACLEHAQ